MKNPDEKRSAALGFLLAGIGVGFVILMIIGTVLLLAIKPWVISKNTPTAAEDRAIVPAEQTLRINLRTFPETIDPQKANILDPTHAQLAHLRLIFEGLARIDQTLQVVPAAAERWDYSADAKILTFTLQKGLKYADGSPLNARRFEFAILRALDPVIANPHAKLLYDIAGAKEWNTSSSDLSSEESERLKASVKVQALDDTESPCRDYAQAECILLRIYFNQPAAYFHTILSLPFAYPAKEELIAGRGNEWWKKVDNLMGNGPFVLSKLTPLMNATFYPNPNYWRGRPKVNVAYEYTRDTAIALKGYRADKFDIIIPGEDEFALISSDAKLREERIQYAGVCTEMIGFNHKQAPFDDQKVREAFAASIDRLKWVRDIHQGNALPALSWVPKGLPGFDETENRYGFSPEKAREALSKSGYSRAEDLPPITATYIKSDTANKIWKWSIAQWEEVLGVTVKNAPLERSAYEKLAVDSAQAPQMFLLEWCGTYPDAQNWFSPVWLSGNDYSKVLNYSDAVLDNLLNDADATLDVDRRNEQYLAAQKLFVGSAPGIFLSNTQNVFLIKPWVKDIQISPFDAGWPGDLDPMSIDIDAELKK